MSLLRTPRDRALVLILVLASAIAFAALPVFSGLLGAGVLYVIFVRPYTKLAGRTDSGLASTLTLIAAVIVVALPLASLVALVVHEAPDALRSVQSESLLQRARDIRIGPFAVGLEFVRAGESIASWLPVQLLRFAGNAASAALNVVIASLACISCCDRVDAYGGLSAATSRFHRKPPMSCSPDSLR